MNGNKLFTLLNPSYENDEKKTKVDKNYFMLELSLWIDFCVDFGFR